MAKKIFYVKSVQQDSKDESKRHYQDVGTIVLHDNDKGTGTLFLNHLPGVSFAVFPKDEKSERSAD
jgi:hypothetical protein